LTRGSLLPYREGMVLRLACLLAALATLAGCGDDSRPTAPQDAAPRDAARADTGSGNDSGATDCEADGDCDDGHACTVDTCGVGGTCRHTPLDERCSPGERCSPERGCSRGCATAGDCDDGLFCNGEEQCIAGMCAPARTAPDCDDGNECTLDRCDDTVGGCRYEPAPGCDAGVAPTDAGGPAPFDPDTHYDGTFLVAPSPSLGCPPSSYSFGEVTFAVSGSELRVTAGRFTLGQNPRPTGGSFDVQGTDGNCGTVRLTGIFDNSDQFSGTWTAGPCRSMLSPSGCGSQNVALFGQRR